MFIAPALAYVLLRVGHPFERGIGVAHDGLSKVVPTVGHVQNIVGVGGAVQRFEEAVFGRPLGSDTAVSRLQKEPPGAGRLTTQ